METPPSSFITDSLSESFGQTSSGKAPLLDRPFLPPNVTPDQLEKPIQSLLYLRNHIPVITPGSAPQLIVPLLETNLQDSNVKRTSDTTSPEEDKKPPLNAFMLFRMTQSMFLTFCPSGRAQKGPKVISKLISIYWKLLVTIERNEWYELADDLKELKELKRKQPALVLSRCSEISTKFAGRPHTPPSAHSLSQVDGKIGPRRGLPSIGSRSEKNRHMLGKFLPVMQAQAQAKLRDRMPPREQSPAPVKPNCVLNDLTPTGLANQEIPASTDPYLSGLPPISELLCLGNGN